MLVARVVLGTKESYCKALTPVRSRRSAGLRATLGAWVLLAATGLLSLSVTAEPPYDRSQVGAHLLLKVSGEDLPAVAASHGLSVLRIPTRGGALTKAAPGSDVTALRTQIEADPRVASVEWARLASLPAVVTGNPQARLSSIQLDLGLQDPHSSPCLTQGFAQAPWSGFAAQLAASIVRMEAGQAVSAHCGALRVAVIDTGVDHGHPALAEALVPGYDFLLEQGGMASEWSHLDQSVQAILENSMRAVAQQSVQAILEGRATAVVSAASMAPVVDPQLASALPADLPTFFGHGTMVAGLIRLVAPVAEIMPLRAFDAAGNGHVYDIVRAIYYAVDHGADVINMSFTLDEPSRELHRALKYAREHGVVAVAAAGNQGLRGDAYPASYGSVLGVGATDALDQLSQFSNWGNSSVSLAAPGDGVISTFPGGLYAAGWGTSFSAPWVSGSAALIHLPGGSNAEVQHTGNALRQGSYWLQDLAGLIGSGRLDVLAATILAD